MPNFRLGGFSEANQVLGVPNQGLNKYAEKRLENTISRAVQRHENALAVDGVGIYLWRRTMSGLICTCRDQRKPLDASKQNSLPVNQAQLRNPKTSDYYLPNNGGDDGFGDPDFRVVSIRGQSNLSYLQPKTINSNNDFELPDEFKDMQTESPDFAEAPLKQERLKEDRDLALMLSTGGALSGGDKTACGICLGTGRNHGYQLYTGQRLILDATNEWPFTLYGSVEPNFNKYPTAFYITGNSNNYLQWVVDLPAFVKNWLNFAIRNNTQSAPGLILEFFTNNAWQPVSLAALTAGNGTDRRATPIRVRIADNADQTITYEFTHAEIFYENTNPIAVGMEPLNLAVNFDVAQPLINTTIEVPGSVIDIPRQSIFQDTKYKKLWQIIDITPHTTARDQQFLFSVSARSIHESEVANVLQTLFNPYIDVAFRGLELNEGGVPSTDQLPIAPNVMRFPENDGNQYAGLTNDDTSTED